MKKHKFITLLLSVTAGLNACSFVSLDPQARDIVVTETRSSLNSCKFLGDTNVSIWSHAETFQSQKSVITQLDTLAKNEAATMGGTTILPKSEINNGQRTYGVYKCKSN